MIRSSHAEAVERGPTPKLGSLVRIRYKDHVHFNRVDPDPLAPHTRKTWGLLRYTCPEYVIIVWDEDDGPPKLRGGDSKASGLVILQSDILELIRVG